MSASPIPESARLWIWEAKNLDVDSGQALWYQTLGELLASKVDRNTLDAWSLTIPVELDPPHHEQSDEEDREE